jgi:hypothetical protein
MKMTLIEALSSGKPFRKKGWTFTFYPENHENKLRSLTDSDFVDRVWITEEYDPDIALSIKARIKEKKTRIFKETD